MSVSKLSIKSVESELQELKELYPRPLPELDLETKPDDTKFTLLEKAALKNFLRLFEREQYQISRTFFINFFTEYETCIERFRSKNGKLNIEAFTHHGQWVQQLITDFITIGLQSKGHMEEVLQNFVVCHHAHNITLANFNLYASAHHWHLLNWFHDVMTPTLENALEKLWSSMREAHEDGARRSSSVPVDFADF